MIFLALTKFSAVIICCSFVVFSVVIVILCMCFFCYSLKSGHHITGECKYHAIFFFLNVSVSFIVYFDPFLWFQIQGWIRVAPFQSNLILSMPIWTRELKGRAERSGEERTDIGWRKREEDWGKKGTKYTLTSG